MTIDTEKAKELLASGEYAYANVILAEHFPGMDKKLERAADKLAALRKEVRTVFPEAQYYTASGGFHLLLGNSHNHADTSPNSELVAWSSTTLRVGDGDF